MNALERIAKAIHLSLRKDRRAHQSWSRLDKYDRGVAFRAASAALEELLEPSAEIIAAFKAERLKAVIEEIGPEYPALHFISDAEAEELLRLTLAVVVRAALVEAKP